MPTDQCGLDCTSLKRRLFCSKWAAIHRNLQELPTIRNLLRRPEENKCVRHLGQSRKIPLTEGPDLWVTSMLTTGAEVGLSLMKGGHTFGGTLKEQISDLAEVLCRHDVLPPCQEMGMYSAGDLTREDENTDRCWLPIPGNVSILSEV